MNTFLFFDKGTVLSWATFYPLIGTVLIGLMLALRGVVKIPKGVADEAARWIALVTSGLSFLAAIGAWVMFDKADSGVQMAQHLVWIRAFNVDPGNVVTARALEHIIRNEGAVPATIAILGGKLKVGLTEAELEHVAQSPGMAKASVRDLPVLIAGKRDGATTVASTMRIAAMAGIRVFATGGIGGVHRGVESTADVSADLTELALSPVAVISAGAKAILDLPRTLEMLETLSVPVIGYLVWSMVRELGGEDGGAGTR